MGTADERESVVAAVAITESLPLPVPLPPTLDKDENCDVVGVNVTSDNAADAAVQEEDELVNNDGDFDDADETHPREQSESTSCKKKVNALTIYPLLCCNLFFSLPKLAT